MIKVIDLHFLNTPKTIAAFLMETSVGPILFETGPYSTFDYLKKGIEEAGFMIEDIKHVFITHIHLDHAGAAWAFAEKGAKIYLHPLGYKHMHDPSKLIQSATRIYQDQMETLWSTIKGIPEVNLKTIEHGEVITIGDTEIKAWYTPGHAVHHIAWQIGDQLIAGDVAGIKIDNGPVVPPCPPPDINIEDWKQSIALLKTLSLKEVYISHYGKVDSLENHFEALEIGLDTWANWMLPHFEAQTPKEELFSLFRNYLKKTFLEIGLTEKEFLQYESANPSWMSVIGLLRYWKKKKEKESEGK